MITFKQWLAKRGISSPGLVQLHQLQAEYYRTVEYPAMLAGFMPSDNFFATQAQAVSINPAERISWPEEKWRAVGTSDMKQISFNFMNDQWDGYPRESLGGSFTPDNSDEAWQTANKNIRKRIAARELHPDRLSDGVFRGSKLASLVEELPNNTISELDNGLIQIATQNESKQLFRKVPSWARGAAALGGAAVGIALLAATKPLSMFSGRDDEYNTIEGLRHDGIAAQKRRELTEFGSGWKGQGLPSSLMGVPIDEEILNFRADILNDPTRKQQYRQWEREVNSGTTPGQLTADDLFAYNTGTINAINEKNAELRAVHLNRFNIDIEDADTLLLKRRGILHLFDEPIQVRLAGIDAPEVAGHADDPLEPIRIWQEQPLGKAAAQRLRGILQSQQDPQLVISSTDQTYGRYLGVVAGDNGENLNLAMLRMGAVADLPFGNPEDDILSRSASHAAQEQAFAENIGIWSQARYQAIHEVTNKLGTSITFNTFTRVDKLAGNLSLGAYGSWLHQLDYQQSDLSAAQLHKARSFAKVLSKNYGRFSGKDDNYNSIEGLRHGGVAQFLRHAMTEFGSGWDPVRNLALQTKLGSGIVGAIRKLFTGGKARETIYQEFIKSPTFVKALAEGKEIKTLGHGSFGTAKLFEGNINGKTFNFVEKIPTAKVTAQEVRAEAHAMYRLSDLNVPTPYAVTKNRRLFMEYMEGKPIDDVHIAGSGLTSSQINELEQQLHKMHSRGIAHTDLMQDVSHLQSNQIIKDTMGWRGEYFPRNMLVTPEGRVAILDMGLAKPANLPATATIQGFTTGANLGTWMEANIGRQATTAADFDNLLIESLRKHGGKLSSRNAEYLKLGSSPDFYNTPATLLEGVATQKKPKIDARASTIVDQAGKTLRATMKKNMSDIQRATAKDMMTLGKGRNHISRGVASSCLPTVR